MKKLIIMTTLVALMTSVNVEAKEVYHNTTEDGIFHEEETITIYDEEDVQDNFLEEDELSWWQRLIQDIFPKSETITIM